MDYKLCGYIPTFRNLISEGYGKVYLDAPLNERPKPMATRLKSIDFFTNAYKQRVAQLIESKEQGKKIVGTFCLYVPDEIIYGAGADRIVLCGGRNDTAPLAEEYLPRNICPLIKSSFGSIISKSCQKDNVNADICPHFGLVDMAVGEATCDGKKKMYEIMNDFIPIWLIDLPQKPDSLEALNYFVRQLEEFKAVMEKLAGNEITDERLKVEIGSANETRRLLHRLYDSRKKDPPPISGLDMLKVLQKHYVLSPEEFRTGLKLLIDEVEQASAIADHHRPRILLSGCPMAGGNTKVTEIIESKGGIIAAEESCTGTRSFWDLVDETGDPTQAIAERYLRIPCSCMTPNLRRVDSILDLAKTFNIDGVVYYTLQFCHSYNIEKYKIQKALKRENIPMLAIESDYGQSDMEQIGVRVEAFIEMLS